MQKGRQSPRWAILFQPRDDEAVMTAGPTLRATAAAACLASGCDGLTVYVSTQPSAVGPPIGAVWVAFEMDVVGVNGEPQDLVFENDRRIAGSSGCNRYSAVFDATPAVRIGTVTTTQRRASRRLWSTSGGSSTPSSRRRPIVWTAIGWNSAIPQAGPGCASGARRRNSLERTRKCGSRY